MRRKVSLQNHRSTGSILEEENKMLKEQVQRLTELMNSDAKALDSRARTFIRPRNESHFKKFNTSTNFGAPKSQSISECQSSITQTLLEMRETQILKMQTEIEEKTREIQELKQRLSRQTQQSIRELSDATTKLNQCESQLIVRDQQLSMLQQQNESVTKALGQMTHVHDYKFTHQLAILSGCAYVWTSLFLHTKTLSLLILIAMIYYGFGALI